ncbi:MAG: hypothetical protein EB059_01665 [Alphaproteobacteria bacterium]|nr:hypothetical protein [Alphaproteobacteria bacterium]
MQRIPSSLLLLISLGLFALPLHAAEPSLVDRLLNMLGNKNLPRIDIQPPAAPAAPPLPAKPPLDPAKLEIGQSFLPIYSFDRSDEDDLAPVLPFFSTAPINQLHKGIQTLVVFIHDQGREAAKAFAFARSAQDEASARHPEWNADASFIFAPQFLNNEDIEAHAKTWPDGGAALLRWVNNGWMFGAESITPDKKGIWQAKTGISSFTALDFALLALARPMIFPDLQKVVIAGTSGGADFVQRYAALGIAPSVLNDEGIEIRFVLSQTNSFLYLDHHRFVPQRNDPIAAKIENSAFMPARTDACKTINSYPFGLDNMPPYGRKNAINEVRLNYSSKRIIYLAGAGATLPIHETTPDACALNAQGTTIKQRSDIFFASLKRLYGEEAERMQKLYLIEGINEDGLSLWRSACGNAALFGDGACNARDIGGKAMQIIK